jgi:Tfp pilus assembly protein PilX
MNLEMQFEPQPVDRQGERGAALLTVLLISILLLSAGLALVTTTSLSTTTSIDLTAEMQAYSAAESGLEATLNVLRGNIAPDATLAGTMMNFRTAAHPALSNKTSDTLATGSSAVARLSGWLNYSYQNPSSVTDWRVPLTASYAPRTGIAYRVEISDPDDQGAIATRRITTEATYIPTRLLVRSEGFGPKGAIKRLEMLVTLAGAGIKTPGALAIAGGPPINLDLGNSAVIDYSGDDMAIPADVTVAGIAVSAGNEGATQTVIDGLHSGSQVLPTAPATINADNSANFLLDADAARAFLIEMQAKASETGRLFSTKAQAIAAGGLGTVDDPKFTFIDNYASGVKVDLGANHQGSGLLIVTGNLETNGNTNFEGLILVLGRGNVLRSGGGGGLIRGSILVAKFDPNGAPGSGFGSPTFTVSGGGTSTIGYDSIWVRKAQNTLGLSIRGVREYHL